MRFQSVDRTALISIHIDDSLLIIRFVNFAQKEKYTPDSSPASLHNGVTSSWNEIYFSIISLVFIRKSRIVRIGQQ